MDKTVPQKQSLSPQLLVVIIAAGLVMLALIAAMVAGKFSPDSPGLPKSPAPKDRSTVTLEGRLVCLPHKNTSGPQTLECAYGLQTDDGTYYALRDTSGNFRSLAGQPMGEPIRLSGTFEQSTSPIYQVVGTVTITSIEEQ